MIILSAAALTAAAQAPVGGISRADMNLTVNPGDDFYEYAGGGWMKANPLKPEYSSFGVFDVLHENSLEQLKQLFADLATEHHEPGTVGQKVTDLYALAMDSTRLNNEGAQPIQDDINTIRAFKRDKRDVNTLTAFLAEQHLSNGNPFFGIGVDCDLKRSDLNVLWVSAGTSGLPDRDYYLNTDEDSRKIQQQYRDFLANMFTLIAGYGTRDAKRAAKTVYDIEYRFAEVKMDRAEARDYNKLYNLRTVEQLQQDYPAINWTLYFERMGVTDLSTIILTEPAVMAAANEFMLTLTDVQMRDYLVNELITSNTGYLSDEIGDASFDFYGRTLRGQQERRPRWKRAMGIPNGLLGEAVGELYVARHFAGDSKQRMLTLIGNLRKALASHIASLTWMSDSTKVNALVKLNTFRPMIGYPDKWRDYSGLNVDPTLSLYANIKAARIFETRRNLDKCGKQVDPDEWGMTPQTVNAYYDPTKNVICFPAAILQPPFFDVNADDASNYGAIGVVIGHEMTHGFDDQGRMFDADGNMTDWWTADDAERFTTAAECLAAQFDDIVVVGDTHANGHLTLGENIADQGGLRIAFDAFRTTQQYKQGETLDGFTPAQRFYLSYGRIWAENSTNEAIFQQTKSDPHSIGRYRVNATLRNIDTFFDAFGIGEGDAMWLEPDRRAVIW